MGKGKEGKGEPPRLEEVEVGEGWRGGNESHAEFR